jgi:hypothetical protein
VKPRARRNRTGTIQASTRCRGKVRLASVAAARRRVRDGHAYLIRRDGAWFRPGAHGYTTALGGAGTFGAEAARGYLDVEGLSVVPVRHMRDAVAASLEEAEAAARRLREMLAL